MSNPPLPQKKPSWKAGMLFMVLLAFALFLCVQVSAVFEISKSVDLNKGEEYIFDGKVIDYNPIWDYYKPVEIVSNLNLPLISSTKTNLYLDKHTFSCGSDCSSSVVIKNENEEGIVIEDIRFLTIKEDGEEVEQPIRSYQIYTKGESTYKEVPKYESVCEVVGYNKINNSEIKDCYNKEVGTELVEEENLIPYTLGEKTKNSLEEFVINGDKKESRVVDWQIKINGVWVDELSIWGDTNSSLNNGIIAYWKLDENTGTVVHDSLGLHNGNNLNGVSIGNLGKINKSFYYDGTDDYTTISNFNVSTPITYSLWINSSELYNEYVLGSWTGDNNQPVRLTFSAGNIISVSPQTVGGFSGTDLSYDLDNVGIKNNTWFNIVYSIGSGEQKLYINGINVINGTYSSYTYSGLRTIYFGCERGGSNNWNGYLDEISFWNRNLSYDEVLQLYNYQNSSDISYPFYFVGSSITINSPLNNSYLNNSLVNFNITTNVVGGANATNISQYIDGVLNETKIITGATNTTIFTKTLSEGLHNQSYIACDTDGDCGNSSVYYFTIDYTAPIINITSPTFENYLYQNKTLDLNYSITDATSSLSACWYIYNNVTKSLNCSLNNAKFNYSVGQNSIQVYANDTLNNIANVNQSWGYYLIEEGRSYPNETIDTKQETFYINLTSLNDLDVKLNYSGTLYNTLEQIVDNDTIKYYTTLNIPVVTSDINKSINWLVLGSTNLTTTNSNVSVKSLNYSLDQTNKLLNITIYDEITGDKLNDTSMEYLIYYYLNNVATNKTLYDTTIKNGTFTFGTNLNVSTLYTLNTLTYQLSGYQPRQYLENLILVGGSITQLKLYLLGNADGTTQLFSVTEATNLQQIPNVKLEAYEQVGVTYEYRDATYTDDSGSGNLWLNPDKVHRITASKEGCTSKTISMYPTGVSVQSIELDCGGVIEGPTYNGTEFYNQYNITVQFKPTIRSIAYDSQNGSQQIKVFNVSYEDTTCNITGGEFRLIDLNTNIVINSGTSTNCDDLISLSQNITGLLKIKAYLLLTKSNGAVVTYQQIYDIIDTSNLTYSGSSISRILQKLTEMNDFGLDQKTKTFIAFIVLFLIIGGLSMSGIIKSEGYGLYLLILAYIGGLSYIGWFTIELPTTFSNVVIQNTLNQYAIFFVSFLIIGGIALSKSND